jgi:NAD(P)H-dependent FMN reductase
VLSCPAYWSGPSGVLKNFLDLLGGPNYREHGSLVFDGAVCVPVVVGADDLSACNALTALRASLAHLGAWVPPRAFTVGNPRQVANRARFVQSLRDFADYVARLDHLSSALELLPLPGGWDTPRIMERAVAGRLEVNDDARLGRDQSA